MEMCDTSAPYVLNISLGVLPESTRTIFFWAISPVMVIAIIFNVLAIFSISIRKTKFLTKICTISLAVSDLLYVIFIGSKNLMYLWNALLIWSFGKFMCQFLPMLNIFLTIISTTSLVIIALDRYQSVVYALGRRWDPKPWTCLLGMLILVMISAGISYPMSTYYEHKQMNVIFVGHPIKLLHTSFKSQCLSTCISVKGTHNVTVYYTCVFLWVFLPIFSMFIWFYYKIADLIWKHRKPLQIRFNKWQNKTDAEEGSSTTKVTSLSNASGDVSSPIPRKKNVQVKKKIRTFRVVVALMIVFIGCRAPFWIFYLFRLCGKLKGMSIWDVNFLFVTLCLLNCALNPLLYAFLKQTINGIKMMNDFCCKICCWCFSNDEFEDFGKDNPFIVHNFEQKDIKVNANCRNQRY